MCRFLMIQADRQIKPADFLVDFADRCKKSKEWQGDGWGVCLLNAKREWQSYKSLKPIWEEVHRFWDLPHSQAFLVHARSSSFQTHKGRLEYNQPFISKNLAFVFNGLIKGVSGIQVEGQIGSQKVFKLICDFCQERGDLKTAIKAAKELIIHKSKEIVALNIGVCDQNCLYALCFFSAEKDYYTLFYSERPIKIICSEQLSNCGLVPIKNGQLIAL